MAAVRAACPAGPVGADSPAVLLVDPWLRANWGRTLSRVLSSFCSRASRRRSTCSFSLLSISSRRRSIGESNSLQTWGTMWPHYASKKVEFFTSKVWKKKKLFPNSKGWILKLVWAFLEQQGPQIMLFTTASWRRANRWVFLCDWITTTSAWSTNMEFKQKLVFHVLQQCLY